MAASGSIRVAAYFTTPEQREIALAAMRASAPEQVREFSGLIEGIVDPTQIPHLATAGLSVEVLDAPPAAAVSGVASGHGDSDNVLDASPSAAASAVAPGHDDAARTGPTPDTAPAVDQAVPPPATARPAPPAPGLTPPIRRASELVAALPEDHALRRTLSEFTAQARTLTPTRRGFVARGRSASAADARSGEQMYYVRLNARLSRTERSELTRLGVRLSAHAPSRWCRALLPANRVAALRALPFVASVREPSVGDFISADFLRQLERARQGTADTPRTFDLTLHRAGDLSRLTRLLSATPEAEVVASGGATVRFTAPIRAPFLAPLVAMPEVASLTPVRPAELLCDYGRAVIGVDVVQTAHAVWSGEGEVVGVIDSGIDATHPDLRGQVASSAFLVSDDANDTFGHGTHVGGIVAGTGAASGGSLRGVAPGAKLAVLKVTDGAVFDLPPDMATFLQPVVDAKAKVVNLSLGISPGETGSVYDHHAYSTDEFVHRHPDVLLVVAAGNKGYAPDGTCAFNTMSSPGTAKNVLTVGASLTSRIEPQQRWGERSPSVFTIPPASDEPVTGDPNLPAASSGRGPGSYGLVKPDLLAPGTYILSTRASTIDPRLPWLACPDHGNRYVYIGGSSMAAPFAAGAAAIVRQYLRMERGLSAPSAALLKAILIVSATRLPSTRASASASDVGFPDYDQGFGRIDLASVLPHPDAPARRRLDFIDVANDASEALERGAPVGSGRRPLHEYVAAVAAGATDSLRVALTWTDQPGSGVQNHLGLELIRPDGSRVAGNTELKVGKDPISEHPDAYGLYWDKLNCVELVAIAQPPSGAYRLRIIALDTPVPPQGYALAVCGEFDRALDAPGATL